jgi:hypothetical protein
MKIWTECQGAYLPLAKDGTHVGKVLDVSEGVNGEDRFTFRCAYCGSVHTNAQATR